VVVVAVAVAVVSSWCSREDRGGGVVDLYSNFSFILGEAVAGAFYHVPSVTSGQAPPWERPDRDEAQSSIVPCVPEVSMRVGCVPQVSLGHMSLSLSLPLMCSVWHCSVGMW
jgi:hypothetical protein